MTIREELELREMAYLSPYAVLSKNSKGRKRKEPECDLRPVFQRDRDRILHCKSFRRLKQKTQVFLSPTGDHYRTRMTHTLEVAQTARTIAKALRLNEDLTEAIALGHDLGHTPFGHAGERALNDICPEGFRHNEQSVRVVEILEKQGEGLNLTEEVVDGILNHKSSGTPHTLEGKIVRLSDKIAYINHDIDDAIRGGILKEGDLPGEYTALLGNSTRTRLNTLIHDVITHSMNQPDIRMSEEGKAAMTGLRQFMFANVYRNPTAKGEEEKAIHMITNLYEYYVRNPKLLPKGYLDTVERRGESKERAVCDYIAGMSDSYSIDKFEELFIPKSWKVH